MADPILDEIWRVREELLKQHGGFDGYFQYVQRLDRLRRRKKRQGARKPKKLKAKSA